jgi:hypothetical protein
MSKPIDLATTLDFGHLDIKLDNIHQLADLAEEIAGELNSEYMVQHRDRIIALMDAVKLLAKEAIETTEAIQVATKAKHGATLKEAA